MFRSSCRSLLLCSLALIVFSCGCSMMPEFMQPHELWKLNRGSGPSTDPFTSRLDRKNGAQIIPTSYDRPAVVNDRPQFGGLYEID